MRLATHPPRRHPPPPHYSYSTNRPLPQPCSTDFLLYLPPLLFTPPCPRSTDFLLNLLANLWALHLDHRIVLANQRLCLRLQKDFCGSTCDYNIIIMRFLPVRAHVRLVLVM